MNAYIDNRHIIHKILNHLSHYDLIKMRCINWQYKYCIDTCFRHKFIIHDMIEINEPLCEPKINMEEFIQYISYFTKYIHQSINEKINYYFDLLNYILKYFYLIKKQRNNNSKSISLFYIKITQIKIQHNNYHILPFIFLKKFVPYYLEQYRNIFLEDNIVNYFRYIPCFKHIYDYLEIDDLLNLSETCKDMRKFIINIKDSNYRNINNMRNTRYMQILTKISEIPTEITTAYNSIIDMIDNNKIYCTNRFYLCNKLANYLIKIYPYKFKLNMQSIKKYFAYLMNNNFIATEKLMYVIKRYNKLI